MRGCEALMEQYWASAVRHPGASWDHDGTGGRPHWPTASLKRRKKDMDILAYIQRRSESLLMLSGLGKFRKERPAAPDRLCKFGHKVDSEARVCSYGHRPA